ncbi:MAG: leucine-rich repeat domain-containing protein, partial [Acetatifactor sp.]|nr:leucine-rich repeat domain-containing protein [Acetatifactor sp.]
AFYECSSLGLVNLNEGLETIGVKAFSGAGLGETSNAGKIEPGTLTIPSTVRSIGAGAFYKCTHLGKVIFADGDTAVLEISGGYSNWGAFGSCPELTMVMLPERIAKLERNTFYDEPKLQTLYIPSKVTEIESNAISNCPNITIYGVSGSAAETYAKQNKIPFKNKDELNISL